MGATYTQPALGAISAGTQKATSGQVVFSNSNGISFGMSGSSRITASYTVPTQTVQTQSLIAGVYDGANSISTGTIRFTNANGVSFSINGQTISGSVAVQTNQTLGAYALGNTTGESTSSTFDARTLSLKGFGAASVGYSNSSIVFSVPNVVAQTNQTLGYYAVGNTTGESSSSTFDARTISYKGLGAASVGFSNSTVQISVPVQTVQTQSLIAGVYDGANSISTGTIRFTNANGVSFSINGQTISGSVAAQTNQTIGAYALGNTTGESSSSTFDARTLSLKGFGAASVGYSNSSIIFSVPTQTVQTQSLIAGIYDGANSISTGTIRFTNANGVSFSINGQTISGSVAAQTNQTLGLYATGNTTGESSSSTFDARSMTFKGLGIASVGYSNSSILISVPSGGGAGDGVNIIAAGSQTANTTGTVVFSNSNGVSFGMSNSSVVTASVAAQTNQTVGFYATGNTTQNSSTTLDARTVSYNALGAMTMGFSNGSIQVSAPATSSLSATGGISISTNGSTISIGVPINATLSAYDPFFFMTGSGTSSAAPASWIFNKIVFPQDITVSNINVFKSVSAATNHSATSQNSSATFSHSYTHGITVFTRQDFGANSTNMSTYTTASIGISMVYNYSSGSQSAKISWVTNTTGGTTSFSTTSSNTGLLTRYFLSNKILQIPCITKFTAGEYFFAHQHTSTSSSAGGNTTITAQMFYSNVVINNQASSVTFGHFSTSASYAFSHVGGQGFGQASAVTTNNTMALSVISVNNSCNYWLMNFSNA